MEGLRLDSAAARAIAAGIQDEAFVLIDVGCSGGLDPAWYLFGDRLRAFGFDPSLAEVERLNRANTHPGVRFISGFVGAPPDNPARQSAPGVRFDWRNPSARLAWWRTGVLASARASGEAPPPREAVFQVREVVDEAPQSLPASAARIGEGAAPAGDIDDASLMSANQWHRAALADDAPPIVLDAFFAREGLHSVDFVKIDADSVDFEILTSLKAEFDARRILAVGLEVNFIGGAASNQHTFHNTDRFMREQGFDLAALTVRPYSSSALPFNYTTPYPLASMNCGGRPYQGDALYVRDFGYPDTHAAAATYSDDKLLKLAAIHAVFGRVDQAAEILLMFGGRLGGRLDIEPTLDLLTAELHALQGPGVSPAPPRSYAEHMARFEADDPSIYGADTARARLQADADTVVLQAEALKAEAAAFRQAFEAVTRSTSWRLTAPLRRLASVLRR